MPYLFLAILVVFLLGDSLFPHLGKIIYGGDLLTQFYFWKGFLVENLKKGEIPFWNPYNFSGTPFLAHPGVAPFYPATLIYLIFPLNTAFSLNYALHLFIGGLGMYFLARKYMDKLSSIISSSIFIYSGYFAARIYAGHVDLVATAVLIPWVFLSLKNFLELPKRRNFLLAVLFLSLEILAGYSAYVLFTLELIFLYCLFYLYKEKIYKNLHKLKKIFLSTILIIILSIFITSIQWLPTWQFTKNSIRGEGLAYQLASWGSLPISGMKLFIDPFNREELNKIPFNLGGSPRENPFDHFVGRLPVLTIGIFILLKLVFPKLKVDRDFWAFFVISLFFFWISFAHFFPINIHQIFYNSVPFYRFIRIPLQHLVIVVLLIPLMVGMIISQFKNIHVKLILLIFFILELFLFDKQYIFTTDISDKKYDRGLISYLQDHLKKERLLPDYRVISPVLEALDLNAVMKYKIETTSGYDPMILGNYYRFVDLIKGNFESSVPFYNVEIPPIGLNKDIVRYLDVGYVLTEKNTNLQAELFDKLIFIKESNIYRLYQIKNSLLRFFLVNDIKIFKTKSDLELSIKEKKYDLAKTVLTLESDIKNLSTMDLSCDNNRGEVKEISRSLNKIFLQVTLDCNSFLSSSEVYYPGWQAKIDGLDTKILLSNLAFRGIFIPKGEHLVEFHYQPIAYYIGSLISLTSVLSILIFAIFVYRNKRNTLD